MSGARALVAACAGLALAAVLLWAGSVPTWYRVAPADGGPVAVSGALVAPWLGPVALLALAGIAAVVATGGLLRALVGALLGLVGVVVCGYGGWALVRDPFATDAPASQLPQVPQGVAVDDLRYQPTEVTAAPLLVLVAGLLVLLVGALVLVRRRQLPRLGARFGASGRSVERDPDRTAWQELDAGRDPTVEAPRSPRGEPGDGPRDAAV